MTMRRLRAAAVDTAIEAAVGVLGRPGRASLTIVGMTIAVAALVATVGITQTAGHQILTRLQALDRTLVRVIGAQITPEFGIPWEAERSVDQLDGVRATGMVAEVTQGADVQTGLTSSSAFSPVRLDVVAASSGLIETVEATIAEGRFFDPLSDHRPSRVAVLGPTAARLLKVDRVTPGRDAIFVDDVPYSVIGILEDAGDEPALANTVLVSRGAVAHTGVTPNILYVRTDREAAEVVAPQLAVVTNPNHPDSLSVSLPPSVASVQEAIESDVDGLFITLGGVALLVAAVGIANVALVAVVERRSEIGLRRALGATRTRVGAEFLTESAVLGFMGGVLGTSVGVVIISLTAARRAWLPIVDPAVVTLGPLLGTLTGLLAGVYPAYRAASQEPTRALRSS